MLWVTLYLTAVFGSFASRVIWWLEENEPEAVWRELRLGWKRYLLEDLTAGLVMATRFLGGDRTLQHQSRAVNDLLEQVAEEIYQQRYYVLEPEQRARVQAVAETKVDLQLQTFRRIVERLEMGRRAAKLAWITGVISAFMNLSPVKWVMAIASAETPVDTVICLSGPVGDGDDRFGINLWRLNGGDPRFDLKWGFHGTDEVFPFAVVRWDEAAGARLGLGAAWSVDLAPRVKSTGLFRAFTNGTRGSPAKFQAWPQLSYAVTDELSLGGYLLFDQPVGGELTVMYGPTADYQLNENTAIGVQAYFPGPSVEVDLMQAVAW